MAKSNRHFFTHEYRVSKYNAQGFEAGQHEIEVFYILGSRDAFRTQVELEQAGWAVVAKNLTTGEEEHRSGK